MIVIASALVVATGVCLVFNTTRLLGVLGVLLLLCLFPIVFLALLLLGGAAIFYAHKRSTNHV
jgi:hypothetical protein